MMQWKCKCHILIQDQDSHIIHIRRIISHIHHTIIRIRRIIGHIHVTPIILGTEDILTEGSQADTDDGAIIVKYTP